MSDNYKESYGGRFGHAGRPPDRTRCCAVVTEQTNGWYRDHQCTRKRGFGPNGDYCKQHDPAAAEARRKASRANEEAKYEAFRMEAYGRAFHDALRKIADGHNDPRTLASEILDKFEKNSLFFRQALKEQGETP